MADDKDTLPGVYSLPAKEISMGHPAAGVGGMVTTEPPMSGAYTLPDAPQPLGNHPADGVTAMRSQETGMVGSYIPKLRRDNGDLLPGLAAPKTVRIVGDNNGWGLSRDAEILTRVLEDLGWSVFKTDRQDVASHVAVAVCIHLEIPAEGFFPSARRNVIIPNPEWWSPEWNGLLKRPSVCVWAKTEEGYRVFRDLGARVARVGFQSADRLDAEVPRDPVFLHVAGDAPHKGTAALVLVWRKEWPELTVVGSDRLLRAVKFPPWVVARSRLAEEDLRTLQNRSLFHIYPSRSEGFGHAQWEGMSCGAVVVVPDAPPFDAWPGAFFPIPTGDAVVSTVGVTVARRVSPEAIAIAVPRAMSLSGAEIQTRREASRATWEHAAFSFREAVKRELALVEGGVATTSFAGMLADFPPMGYVGRVNCVTGYGTAARHQIWTLRKHGLRLKVIDAGSTQDPDPKREDHFVQESKKTSPGVERTCGTILHLAPNCVTREHFQNPRPHILVSVWETTRLPKAWVPIINRFDQVWCATDWQREVYADSGVEAKRLHVVPFAVDPSLYGSTELRLGLSVLPDVRREVRTTFGTVFQWTERKNPRALLDAYFRAFSAKDPVTLVLKGYEGDNPRTSVAGRVQEIVRSLHHLAPPDVRVISRPFTSREMAAFYQSIDGYVSSHCGEGFGFPIAEALLWGKLVIATGWSAPAEYADGCFTSIPYTLVPPHGMSWQPFYTPDQRWASVDVDALAMAMRAMHEGKIACPYDRILEKFEVLFERAGLMAKKALEALE